MTFTFNKLRDQDGKQWWCLILETADQVIKYASYRSEVAVQTLTGSANKKESEYTPEEKRVHRIVDMQTSLLRDGEIGYPIVMVSDMEKRVAEGMLRHLSTTGTPINVNQLGGW